jgi:hypothetical protein
VFIFAHGAKCIGACNICIGGKKKQSGILRLETNNFLRTRNFGDCTTGKMN